MRRILISMLLSAFAAINILAQTTAFTYQGSLKDGANPANGNFDFEFKLFDAVSAGTQQGSTQQRLNVAVVNGVFAVSLDFGAGTLPGADRFLDIAVRTAGGGAFTTLAPRQLVNSAPYAVRSVNAANADNATNATTAATATNALQLGGVAANQYVLTGDPRMSDARNPLPGSSNYVQNGTTPQAGSFNLSGSGTVGNTLTGTAINAVTEYRLGGARVLGNTGTNNLFVGVGAGSANTTGQSNAFVGFFAGTANTTANGNSFFGALAGRDTNIGIDNSFFGSNAGLQNTNGQGNVFLGRSSGGANTTGIGNNFLGKTAGGINTTGSFNNIFGFAADVLAPNLTNATAIGARAAVGQSNSLVLGSINGVNGATADTNVGIGTTAPSERLHVVGNGLFTGNLNVNGTFTATLPAGSANYIQNTTTQQAVSNFNISGDGMAAGTLSGNIISAGTQFNLGANRILSNAGLDNLFAGVNSGTVNTGAENAFFGKNSGSANTSGNLNSFFGAYAGESNQTALSNSFFGNYAGKNTTTGSDNSFFGRSAGLGNQTGTDNSFFGRSAGLSSTGSNNSFFGSSAGNVNVSGNNNTIIGAEANVSAGGLSNATAIGYRSMVAQSNSLILGATSGVNGAAFDTSIGIGTTTPEAPFDMFTDQSTSRTFRITKYSDLFSASLIGRRFGGTRAAPENVLNGDILFQIGAVGHNSSNNEAPSAWISFQATENFGGLANRGTRIAFFSSENGNSGINSPRMMLDHNGNVAIGNISPAAKLDVDGIIRVATLGAAGATALCRNASQQISTCSSSLRYKTNIRRFDDGLWFVNKLRPITFDWKDGGMKDVGFGAEDIAKIDPRFVTFNDKGEVEGVKYDRMSVAFVNAIKEQQAQIESQQEQIEQQRSEIEALKALVCLQNPGVAICRPKK